MYRKGISKVSKRRWTPAAAVLLVLVFMGQLCAVTAFTADMANAGPRIAVVQLMDDENVNWATDDIISRLESFITDDPWFKDRITIYNVDDPEVVLDFHGQIVIYVSHGGPEHIVTGDHLMRWEDMAKIVEQSSALFHLFAVCFSSKIIEYGSDDAKQTVYGVPGQRPAQIINVDIEAFVRLALGMDQKETDRFREEQIQLAKERFESGVKPYILSFNYVTLDRIGDANAEFEDEMEGIVGDYWYEEQILEELGQVPQCIMDQIVKYWGWNPEGEGFPRSLGPVYLKYNMTYTNYDVWGAVSDPRFIGGMYSGTVHVDGIGYIDVSARGEIEGDADWIRLDLDGVGNLYVELKKVNDDWSEPVVRRHLSTTGEEWFDSCVLPAFEYDSGFPAYPDLGTASGVILSEGNSYTVTSIPTGTSWHGPSFVRPLPFAFELLHLGQFSADLGVLHNGDVSRLTKTAVSLYDEDMKIAMLLEVYDHWGGEAKEGFRATYYKADGSSEQIISDNYFSGDKNGTVQIYYDPFIGIRADVPDNGDQILFHDNDLDLTRVIKYIAVQSYRYSSNAEHHEIISNISISCVRSEYSIYHYDCQSVDAWRKPEEWFYRKSHTIVGSSGAGTNYQIKMTAHFGSGTDSGDDVYLNSHCQTDFGDVRFVSSDGTTFLDYWMESVTDSDQAVFWVEIQDNLDSDQTIYIYYGNDDVDSASDGESTFIAWDDFDEGYSVQDNPKSDRGWTQQGKDGSDVFEINNNPSGRSGMGLRYKEDSAGGSVLQVWNEWDKVTYDVAVHFRFHWVTIKRQFRFYVMDEDWYPNTQFKSYRYVSGDDWQYVNGAGSWVDFQNGMKPYEDTWYDMEYRMDMDGTPIFWIDGNTYNGDNRYDGDGWDRIRFYGHDDYSDEFYLDDFYVRKWIPNEPSYGEWSAEERLGFESYWGIFDSGELKSSNGYLYLDDIDPVSSGTKGPLFVQQLPQLVSIENILSFEVDIELVHQQNKMGFLGVHLFDENGERAVTFLGYDGWYSSYSKSYTRYDKASSEGDGYDSWLEASRYNSWRATFRFWYDSSTSSIMSEVDDGSPASHTHFTAGNFDPTRKIYYVGFQFARKQSYTYHEQNLRLHSITLECTPLRNVWYDGCTTTDGWSRQGTDSGFEALREINDSGELYSSGSYLYADGISSGASWKWGPLFTKELPGLTTVRNIHMFEARIQHYYQDGRMGDLIVHLFDENKERVLTFCAYDSWTSSTNKRYLTYYKADYEGGGQNEWLEASVYGSWTATFKFWFDPYSSSIKSQVDDGSPQTHTHYDDLSFDSNRVVKYIGIQFARKTHYTYHGQNLRLHYLKMTYDQLCEEYSDPGESITGWTYNGSWSDTVWPVASGSLASTGEYLQTSSNNGNDCAGPFWFQELQDPILVNQFTEFTVRIENPTACTEGGFAISLYDDEKSMMVRVKFHDTSSSPYADGQLSVHWYQEDGDAYSRWNLNPGQTWDYIIRIYCDQNEIIADLPGTDLFAIVDEDSWAMEGARIIKYIGIQWMKDDEPYGNVRLHDIMLRSGYRPRTPDGGFIPCDVTKHPTLPDPIDPLLWWELENEWWPVFHTKVEFVEQDESMVFHVKTDLFGNSEVCEHSMSISDTVSEEVAQQVLTKIQIVTVLIKDDPTYKNLFVAVKIAQVVLTAVSTAFNFDPPMFATIYFYSIALYMLSYMIYLDGLVNLIGYYMNGEEFTKQERGILFRNLAIEPMWWELGLGGTDLALWGLLLVTGLCTTTCIRNATWFHRLVIDIVMLGYILAITMGYWGVCT